MSEDRPVKRIPSIFDSEDDSDDEPPSPVTFRPKVPPPATITTNDSSEPPVTKLPVVSESSESEDSEADLVVKSQAVAETASPSKDGLSSHEESDDSEEETEAKKLDFSTAVMKESHYDGDEDENEDDGLNVSDSSNENIEGSDDNRDDGNEDDNVMIDEEEEDDDDDDDDDDTDDDDEDEDDDDEELNKSGSSLDIDGEESDTKDGREFEKDSFPRKIEGISENIKEDNYIDTEAMDFNCDKEKSIDKEENTDTLYDIKKCIDSGKEAKTLVIQKDTGSENREKEVVSHDRVELMEVDDSESKHVEKVKKLIDKADIKITQMEVVETLIDVDTKSDIKLTQMKAETLIDVDTKPTHKKYNEKSVSVTENADIEMKDVDRENSPDSDGTSLSERKMDEVAKDSEIKSMESMEKGENNFPKDAEKEEKKNIEDIVEKEDKNSEGEKEKEIVSTNSFDTKEEEAMEIATEEEDSSLLCKEGDEINEASESEELDEVKEKDEHREFKEQDVHKELKEQNIHKELKTQDVHTKLKENNKHIEVKEKDHCREFKEKDEHIEIKKKDEQMEVKEKDEYTEVKEKEDECTEMKEKDDEKDTSIEEEEESCRNAEATEQQDVSIENEEMKEKDVKLLEGEDHSKDSSADENESQKVVSVSQVRKTKTVKGSFCANVDMEKSINYKKSKGAGDKISASVAREAAPPLGRIPVKVEDVYTDSEEEKEDSQEPNKNKEKSTSDVPVTSETDSADELDQKDSLSAPGSSRGSSIEPGNISRDSSGKASLGRDSPLTPDEKSLKKLSMLTSVLCIPRPPKKYSRKPFSLEDCMKAFEKGWKREIVYRATVDPHKSGTKADIYYYSPTGKKLRSKVEIEDYMSRHEIKDLCLENFTWIKEPIGVKEEYEQIRHASKYLKWCAANSEQPHNSLTCILNIHTGSGGSRGKSSTPSVCATPPQVTKCEPVTPSATPVSTKRKRGRPPKTPGEKPVKRARMKITPIIPLSLKQEVEPSSSVKKTYPQTPVTVKPSSVVNTQATSSSPVTLPAPIQPSVNKSWNPVITLASTPNLSSSTSQRPILPAPPKADLKQLKSNIVYSTKICNEPIVPSKILTPMLSSEIRQRTFHCTGHCLLGGGMVPCLQCVKCLCLFHPECTYMPPPTVNIIQSGAAKFLCPNCYREIKENVGINKWVPPRSCEPLSYDPPSEDSENEGERIDRVISYENYARVSLRPDIPLTPPSSPPPPGCKVQEEARSKIFSGCQAASLEAAARIAESSMTMMSHMQTTQLGSGPASVMSNNTGIMGAGAGAHGNMAGNQMLQLQAPGSSATRFLLVRAGANGEVTPVQGGTHVGIPRGILLPTSLVGGQMPFMLAGSSPRHQQGTTPIMLSGSMQQQQATNPLMLSGNLQQQQVATPIMLSGSAHQQQVASPIMLPVPTCAQQQQVAALFQQATSMMQPTMEKPAEKQQKSFSKGGLKSECQYFLRDLSQSYRLLLRVFKYLSVKDLLKASQVCLLWRDLAYSPSLWRTVRLRNVCVRDWNDLARFLERRNTRNIDLRKMVFREKLGRNKAESSDTNKEEFSSPSRAKSEGLSTNATTSSPDNLNTKQDSLASVSEDLPQELCSTKEYSSKTKERHTEDGNIDKRHKKNESPENQESRGTITSTSETPENNYLKEISQDKEMAENKSDILGKSTSHNAVQRDGKEIVSGSDAEENKGSSKEDILNVSQGSESLSQKSSSENCKDVESLLTFEPKHDDEKMECDAVEEIYDKDRETSRRKASKAKDSREKQNIRKTEEEVWKVIFNALGTVRSMRAVTLPTCEGEVLQMLLTRCKQLTSVSATEFRSASGAARFDPAYLMEASELEELRIGSSKGFFLTNNFNFIKLQKLRVLVMRGLSGPCWPYLGTNLTSLHVGPISNFSPQTWSNIGSMTNLEALWLEDGGSLNDTFIYDAISRLCKLSRLCLFNFTVGAKLGQAVKKLLHLERLFVLPAPSEDGNISTQHGNMLAVTETMRHVDELVWAIRFQDIQTIGEVDHIQMCPTKAKMYTGFTSNDAPDVNLWTLQRLETIVKRHLPRTKVRIMKLDTTAASRLAMSTL